MKIIHLNYSDNIGGAAKAAFRIHQSLIKEGYESEMWVCKSGKSDLSIRKQDGYLYSLKTHARSEISRLLLRKKIKETGVFHSLSILPSSWPKLINASDADIVNLHWINGEMLSIKDISKIKKPIVWTFHDMWPFSGAEHLSFDEKWQNGYEKLNSKFLEFDWNRLIWNYKKYYWNKPIHIVAPSLWMSGCVKKSLLMSNWPVNVIPNCLDTEYWKIFDKDDARRLLGLPLNKPLLCFGSFQENQSFHKGADLLEKALKKIQNKIINLEIVVFGKSIKKVNLGRDIPTHYLGKLEDESLMRAVYNASDLIAVPSRIESFGQVASEAMACGKPVICFDTCGLKDIVDHKVNGYLAQNFDTSDYAKGILWILDKLKSDNLSLAARNKVLNLFSEKIVANQYLDVYKNAIKSFKNA